MKKSKTPAEIRALARELAERGAEDCTLAVVLGSGLGAFAQALEDSRAFDGSQFEALPAGTVAGHAGRIVIGRCAGVDVLVQEGRVHLYEGRSVREVTRAVRAFGLLGIRGLLLTNSAGCLHREWSPGSFMRVTDHIKLQGRPSLFRGEGASANPYDPELGQALERAAEEEEITLFRGVYAANLGPAYETPAEVEMARWMGADAVGMSTSAEAESGWAGGMRVAAVSCLTNHAAGIASEPLSHDEVIEVGRQASDAMVRLLRCGAVEMARELNS